MNLHRDLEVMINNLIRSYPAELFKNRDFYSQWLAQTYFFVCHSTPLLGYALPHLKNKDLKRHFEHHLSEEERHDLLALKDIERLGYKIEDFQEFSATQAFYQSQYYRISFEGGTSILGYILFLEAIAVRAGQLIYEEIKDVHKGSCLFLKVHAEEDPEHVKGAMRTIMSLSAEEQEAILRNMHYSNEMYLSICETILTEKKSLKAA